MNRAFILTLAAAFLLSAADRTGAATKAPSGTTAATKIETFLSGKGTLLVKDVYILGKVSGLYSSWCDISAIVTYEPGQKENKLKGMIFKIKGGQNEDTEHISYVDLEEIEEVSGAISSMIRLTEDREKADSFNTEITYTTRDNLSFGVYLGETEEEVFISAGETRKMTVYLEPKRLEDVKKIVEYGSTLLKMK